MASLIADSFVPVAFALAGSAGAHSDPTHGSPTGGDSTISSGADCAAEPERAFAAATEGVTAGDWASIRAAHESWKRRVVAAPEGHAARQHAQPWRSTFDGRGVTIEPDVGAWTWGLELERFGFEGALREIEGLTAGCAEGERIEYARDASLTEWYVNGGGGLEHGYTVHERPEGEGTLVFDLAVRGDLAVEIDGDSRGARFVDGAGAAVLRYAGLTVFDAAGHELDARLAARKGGLRLEIDERGALYPLTIDPTVQQAYLKASNTDAFDGFGVPVSVSGDTVVVGAPYEGSNSTMIDMGQGDNSAGGAGAGYVFVRSGTTWSQQAYLKAWNTDAVDCFGCSISVSGDTVVVGAFAEDSNSTTIDVGQGDNSAATAGAAYVFVRSGTTWSQQAYLKASNTDAGDGFGGFVSVSGDTVVIGAFAEASNSTTIGMGQGDNSAPVAGAAYVFVRSGTTWSQQAYLKASNTDAGDGFGGSVSVSGDTVVVGAYAEASNSTTIGMGQGDNSAPVAGAAYVFVRSGTTWSQQAYLKASNTDAGDGYGLAVSVSGDTVVVGTLSEDSNSVAIGMGQGDNSAPGAGAAYVFVRSGTTWSQQAYLKASNTDPGDLFGQSVSVSGDTVVVGAHREDSNSTTIDMGQGDNSAGDAGAAYAFVRSGTTWSQVAYLKASNTDVDDWFGLSISVSGDTVVVGAYFEDSNSTTIDMGQGDNSATDAGAAYVFLLPPPPPVAFCFGDGSGTACPCTNHSPAGGGAGCLTSFGVGGLLVGSGGTRLSSDTLVLAGSQMPNAPSLYFQGTLRVNGGAGLVFGDGLRCAGGALVRLKQVANSGGASHYPEAGDPPVSVRGLVTAPGIRTYQIWFRNNAPFCTPDGWNLTNGVEVTWAP